MKGYIVFIFEKNMYFSYLEEKGFGIKFCVK